MLGRSGSRRKGGQTAPRLRRSPHIVGHWAGGRFGLRNYLEGTAIEIEPGMLGVLQYFGRWRSATDLEARCPSELRPQLSRLIERLLRASILLAHDSEAAYRAALASSWEPWSPDAGFSHFATRKPTIRYDDEETGAESPSAEAPPSQAKRHTRQRGTALPAGAMEGELPRLLVERRTWRAHSRRALSRQDLGTLLDLTWGTRQWCDTEDGRRVPLKTSPSGGACHPIEVYMLAVRVAGVSPGLYHYLHAEHRLERLRSGASAAMIGRYIPGQPRFRGAAALFLMTAVWDRAQWRYKFPRAYRSVLLEAGHFCQTFALVATWLGLAPFQTALFDDAFVEEQMGVDGIRECFVYGAGVGHRPRDGKWRP